jgi:transcriptional regulator with XRE-family HTH domain
LEIDGKLIGERIKDRRIKLNIAQKALAAQVGVSASAINQFEKGEKVPSTSTLIKLAEALDVSSDYLLGVSDNDKIFIDRKVKRAFDDFITLNKSDRMLIMANINFLKDQSKKNPLRKA